MKKILCALMAIVSMSALADTILTQKSGLLPGKYNNHIMEWNRGEHSSATANVSMRFPTEVYTDIATVGAQPPTPAWFAANVPSLTDTSADYPNMWICGKDRVVDPDTWAYGVQFYQILDIPTGRMCVIASPAIAYSDVIPPSAWAGPFAMRKHQFAITYKTAWGGFPNFGIDATGSEVVFTDSEDAGVWAVVYAAQTSGAWQHISLANLLPDAARIARFRAEVRYIDGSAGSAYIRSYSGQTTGKGLGSVSPGSPFQKSDATIQLDSGRGFDYKTTGNARVYLYLDAYRTTDPS